MNTETGKIYKTAEEIEAARKRGEPLVPISDYVAEVMEAGHTALNRKERRKQKSLARRAGKIAIIVIALGFISWLWEHFVGSTNPVGGGQSVKAVRQG